MTSPSMRPHHPRIQAQALRLLERIDPSHPAFSGIDFGSPRDTLLPLIAQRTRSHTQTVPVKPIDLGKPSWPRIANPNEGPEALIARCLTHRWVSVGREYHFPHGVDYNSSPAASLNTAGFPFGEWTWQLNRHHEWQLAARLYHQTGRPRYAMAVVRWLEAWIVQCPQPVEDLNLRQASWRTIEIGLRLGTVWPEVLSALKEATELDDILWLAWLTAYAEQAEFVERYRKENNWLLMEMNGLLHAAIQLPFFKCSKFWEDTSIGVFRDEINTQFHRDGFQRELSTHYMSPCVDNYLMAFKLLKLAHRPIPPEIPEIIQRIHGAWRKLARPNGIAFGFQDGQDVDLRSKLQHLPKELLTAEDHWFLSPTAPPPPRHHSLLENAGYVVLRAGWDADSLCIAFDGGPFGDAHQHEDKLSIQLYAAGKTLIGEAGTVDYSDSPQRHYSLSSLAHSTALIDGMGQNRSKHFSPGALHATAELEVDLTTDLPWAQATYDEGYGPQAIRTVTHTRKVTLLNDRQVEISDHFFASDPEFHQVEILFHILLDEAHVADGVLTATDRDGTTLQIMPSTRTQDPVEMQIATGGSKPDLRGWATPDTLEAGPWILTPRPCLTQKLSFRQQIMVTTHITILR